MDTGYISSSHNKTKVFLFSNNF